MARMTAMERSWERLTLAEKALDVALLVALACFFVVPLFTNAVGDMADQQCTPDKDYTCPFGTPKEKCPKKQKPGGQGMPCTDMTNGHASPGKCVSEMKCKGDDQGGKPPEMPKLPEPPKKEPKQDQPKQDQKPCTPTNSSGVAASSSTSTPYGGEGARGVDAQGNPCTPEGFGGSSFYNPFSSADLSGASLNMLDKTDELSSAIRAIANSGDSSGEDNADGEAETADPASKGILQNARSVSLSDTVARNNGSSGGGITADGRLGQQTFTSSDLSEGSSYSARQTGGAIRGFANGVSAVVGGLESATQAIIRNVSEWIANVMRLLAS